MLDSARNVRRASCSPSLCVCFDNFFNGTGLGTGFNDLRHMSHIAAKGGILFHVSRGSRQHYNTPVRMECAPKRDDLITEKAKRESEMWIAGDCRLDAFISASLCSAKRRMKRSAEACATINKEIWCMSHNFHLAFCAMGASALKAKGEVPHNCLAFL